MRNKIIYIKNLHKSYSMGENKLPVLSGLNLDVFEGEMVTIMGRSGSGKSTLLNTIAGLEDIDQGKIYVNQHETSQLNNKQKVL